MAELRRAARAAGMQKHDPVLGCVLNQFRGPDRRLKMLAQLATLPERLCCDGCARCVLLPDVTSAGRRTWPRLNAALKTTGRHRR